jgi:Nucleotide modification associated domain 1
VHSNTLSQYNAVIKTCQAIFEKKTNDYGTAWRILRLPSMTDQLMIKAQRIRTLQEQTTRRVDEGMSTELVGIVNYSVMALMQIALKDDEGLEIAYDKLAPLYDEIIAATTTLLNNKNHDYQEAWRAMRLSSITDIILMKLLRIKRIEDNQGTTLISEGVASNYQDIINYAVFALIKLDHVDQ